MCLVVCALAALVTACGGPKRSVAAFCSTYHSEKQQFLTRYGNLGTSSDNNSLLTDLVEGVQSLGDVTVILTKLDKVAPSDIQPDMDTVLNNWKQEQSTLGGEVGHAFSPTSVLGDLGKGLFQAAEANGSWTRVGDYINQHCGA